MEIDQSFDDHDDGIDTKAHKRLLNEVANLSKVQHIKKPTRTEPTADFDEFKLVKRIQNPKHVPVKINDLVKVLGKTSGNIEVGKQLKVLHATKKVLPKPLDKPIEDRIKRTIGYQKAKHQLQRWNGIVSKIRNSDCQIFPLKRKDDFVEKSAKEKGEICIKSEFIEEFEQIDKEFSEKKPDTDDGDKKKSNKILHQSVSKEELTARRRELYYLKLKQSQKSAKEFRRNKIKSKRYRKLLKRQKLKQQIDEFEQLQKTDPEAAEEKLKLIEKNRILERASLRHKNTGLWAKNNQIKAKYNTEIRKDLADQLSLSRQLTQKKEISENNINDWYQADSVLMDAEIKKSNIGMPNPWVRPTSKTIEKEENQCSAGESDVNKSHARDKIGKIKEIHSNSEWIVEEIDSNDVAKMSVDDIFDLSENAEFTKVHRKQKKNKRQLTEENQLIKQNKKSKKISEPPLKPPIVDDVHNIDTTIVAEVKPTVLQNATCEMSTYGEEDLPEDTIFDKQLAMMEAFQDDEIMKDFSREKENIASSKNAEQELNLTMAGWGSWAGSGISNDATKNQKQLKLKFQMNEMKGEQKNDRVIEINEANIKLRQHLVSDIPFPFTSVEDYEASIRAPLGRTFNPETATRLLTKPKLITRSGQIINPMDESELVRCPGKKKIYIS